MAQDPNAVKDDKAEEEKKVDADKKELKVADFAGTWTLRTSEKLDEYLKSEGWGFIMRKAAAAVGARQIITQDDKTITVNVKNKKGEYEYTAPFDGTKYNYIDNDKDDVESTTCIEQIDEGVAIKEKMIKGKDKKEYTTYRYMRGDEMCLKIQNSQGLYCIRLFKKDK
eukprot:UN00770